MLDISSSKFLPLSNNSPVAMDVLSQGGSNKMRKTCHRPFPSFSAVQVAVPADLDKEMPAVSHPISRFGAETTWKRTDSGATGTCKHYDANVMKPLNLENIRHRGQKGIQCWYTTATWGLFMDQIRRRWFSTPWTTVFNLPTGWPLAAIGPSTAWPSFFRWLASLG